MPHTRSEWICTPVAVKVNHHVEIMGREKVSSSAKESRKTSSSLNMFNTKIALEFLLVELNNRFLTVYIIPTLRFTE